MEFPDILFESYYNESNKPKVCLSCGKDKAVSYLRNMSRVIVPLCDSCSKDWNFYGYYILKRVKPKRLLWNLFLYKLTHFRPSWLTIYRDLKAYAVWGKKMKKFAKHM